ncbi:hypothetical protein JW835_00625 [bacterium]|nr:hypothetical protein [bacterium]
MKRNCMLFLLLSFVINAQGLFDSAVESRADSVTASKYELNGFVRGVYFGGFQINNDDYESKAGYGELGLKLRARKGEWGNGFAEIRMRKGYEFNKPIQEIILREAYINLYPGPFDIRVGEQIVVWGRADGYNPTNNLTPQNMLIRSADDDDRRLSNFLIRSFFNITPFRIELIWVPQYAASVLPIHLFELPDQVQLSDAMTLKPEFDNSTFASKIDIDFSSFGSSVSYMRGFMPLPGIDAKAVLDAEGNYLITVMPLPYQMQVFGMDFSTVLSGFGLRSELAYRDPVKDYSKNMHVPNPDLQYVIGGDHAWGNFSLILQYIGRYVLDFEDYVRGRVTDEIYLKNRMISMQQHEFSHGFSFRPAYTFFHETLTVEALGLVNYTTKEAYIRPKITYQLADELILVAGGDIYIGDDNTLFGSIDRALNSGFIEFKASF